MLLTLIRHAEAAGDSFALPDSPVAGFLSPTGVAQAQALALALSDRRFDAVLTSPYGRCVQTAEALVAGRAIPLERHGCLREWIPNPALRELPSTQYEAMLTRDAQRWADETWLTELGEGCLDMHARVGPPLLRELARWGMHRRAGGYMPDPGAEERSLAVVAHGGSLAVLTAFLLGLPAFPAHHVAYRLTGVATIGFTVRRGVHHPHLVIDALSTP